MGAPEINIWARMMGHTALSRHQAGGRPAGQEAAAIPSPSSLKRKSFNHTDLDLQVSKRHACQPADDISQSTNSINRQSNSDSAQLSKFPLDIQSSRSNNDNRVLQQDKDLNRSHLNKTNELSLLKRITLPPEVSQHAYRNKDIKAIIDSKASSSLLCP
ncbi:hypothetical protein KEM48_001994 [Puccinia striiformis f. sp. tritici PST-130]|nr:hypothetical protein KEM48_001994 [Puccinia striiformis f. sp. tritici PST-130]